MEVVVNSSTIITIAGTITALGVIIGGIVTAVKTFAKWNSYDKKIKDIKDEQYLQIKTMYAILDGLHQLGCNGKTTEASQELDDYLQRKAHDMQTEV